ncbi:MAG: Cof-type HAD-IIB family hydrolase [Lachnospiraceae bacterium]
MKVIIMDVDGTLFNSEKIISEKTKAALLSAQEKGVRLILASGRPTTGLISLGQELMMNEHNGLFVSYNGSKVVNCQTRETLFNEPLSIEAGKQVLEHMKGFQVYPMIDKGNYMYVNDVFADLITWNGRDINIIQYEARNGNFLLCEQADLTSFLDYEVNKILTAGDPDYLQQNYKAMMEPFKDTLSCMFTADFYFEFTAKEIDKAKALDTVLRPMGYEPEDMIGFGDGMNDLSMIKYVGTGVAMDNAVPALKEAADYVTASNDEDGIAKALERFEII